MREGLTIVAAALVALLTAALVGPWLIDWTAHRDALDAQLSRALGADIHTRGAIDLKFLPTPILALDGFELATANLSATAGPTRLELQIMPLMRGELRFYEASIRDPDIVLRAPAAIGETPPAVRLDRVRVENARVRLTDASGAEIVGLSAVDLDGAVDSLMGPFRGAGALRRGDGKIDFRFTTSALDNGRMRIKLLADEMGTIPRLDLDGGVDLSDPAHPAFEGQAIIAASSPVGWRVAGPLRLDVAGARMEKLEARLDASERDAQAVATLEGAASIDFSGDGRATATLSARQLDIDRLAGHPVAELARAWLGDSGVAARLNRPIDISLTTPAALLGPDTLSDVQTGIHATPGASPSVRLSVGAGPGGSRLDLSGDVETGAAAAFRGRVTLGARDLPRFAEFLSPLAPDEAARLRALPTRNLDVAGDFVLSAAGFSARNLSIHADRTVLTGASAYTRAVGGERARFFADLSSDAFDVETAPDLTAPASALADADLAISLDARAIRVARFGDGAIDAGRIRLALKRDGETTRLERLSIADLGGATLSLAGTTDAAGGHAEGSIAANRLADLAAFLRRIAPGPLTDALAARATALSPAKLAFRLEATRADAASPLTISALSLDGDARGTAIKANARPDGPDNAVAGSLSLSSADAALLARQIGVTPAAGAGLGAARIDLSARGAVSRGFDIETTAHAAGATASFHGRIEGGGRAAGDAALDAPDIAAALRLLDAALPDASLKAPAKLAAHVALDGDALAFTGLTGAVAGATVAGDVTLAPTAEAAPRPHWTGALHLGALSAPALAQLVLGPERALRPGETWSAQKFAAGMAHMPRADIDVTADTARLAGGLSAADAHLRLSLQPFALLADGVTATVAGGRFSDGRLSLRRDGDMAAMTLAGRLDDVAINRPAVAARASGTFSLTSTGDAPAALAAGLAGQGRFTLADIAIPRADPAAPGRVLARADAGDLFISDNDIQGALRRELDAAPWRLASSEFNATIAGGNLRLVSTDGVTLAWNVATGDAESRVALTTAPLPKDWDGPPPRLTVVWKEPIDTPARDLDAGLYDAAVIAHAVAREQARIEALEADIRERAAFVRRQRGLDFLNQREREVAAWQAEQERLARIEEQRRAEEAARAERERRAAEERARAEEARRASAAAAAAKDVPRPPADAPLDITPPAPPSMPPHTPGADPAAAGRY